MKFVQWFAVSLDIAFALLDITGIFGVDVAIITNFKTKFWFHFRRTSTNSTCISEDTCKNCEGKPWNPMFGIDQPMVPNSEFRAQTNMCATNDIFSNYGEDRPNTYGDYLRVSEQNNYTDMHDFSADNCVCASGYVHETDPSCIPEHEYMNYCYEDNNLSLPLTGLFIFKLSL